MRLLIIIHGAVTSAVKKEEESVFDVGRSPCIGMGRRFRRTSMPVHITSLSISLYVPFTMAAMCATWCLQQPNPLWRAAYGLWTWGAYVDSNLLPVSVWAGTCIRLLPYMCTSKAIFILIYVLTFGCKRRLVYALHKDIGLLCNLPCCYLLSILVAA